MERLEPTSEQINSKRNTKQFKWSSGRSSRNRNSNKFVRFLRLFKPNELHDNKSRRGPSNSLRVIKGRHDQPDHNTEGHSNPKRHRHNFNVYTISTLVLSLLSPTVALAENVGGVSATGNPIANSSEPVTNQVYRCTGIYNQYLRWWRAMSRIYIELYTLRSVCRF